MNLEPLRFLYASGFSVSSTTRYFVGAIGVSADSTHHSSRPPHLRRYALMGQSLYPMLMRRS